MKPGIHPNWYPDAVVTCACGNTFTTGSTKKEIHTDVCSNCHPFFTGEQRIVDTAGQVERFMKRAGAKDRIAATRPVTQEKHGKKDKQREEKPAAMPVAPAELPLAVAAEEIAPELPAIEMPAMEAPQPEPVAEARPAMPAPVAPVETLPTLPTAPEPEVEPVAMSVAETLKVERKVKTRAAKSAAKKASAKKPAAKAKKAAPKAKAASKPKASAVKKPSKAKITAKKKSRK